MKATKQNILKLLCSKAFIQGNDPDIFGIIGSYKLLNNIDEELQEALYNYIADNVGVSRTEQLTDKQRGIIDKFVK